MKNLVSCFSKIFLVVLLFSSFFTLSFAQSNDTKNCNGYFAHKAGTKMDMTVYDKKDKVTQILKYQVTNNTSTSTGTIITFANQVCDKNGKQIVEGTYNVECKSEQVYIDVNDITSNMTPIADAEVTITGDKLAYPLDLTTGQKLKDIDYQIKQTMSGGMALMNLTVSLTNRKVEGFETVTTPAGTFECVKVSYESDIKAGFVKKKSSCVEYLAKGVGLVKLEIFNKKGKKETSQLLTKLER